MAWISVYQEVDGPKLRKLAKLLETSKAEALGILNFLWFWGMNNADETGRVLEAGREDIGDAIAGVSRVDSKAIVDALFAAGWLDAKEDDIFIHDWDTWQEQWYKLQKIRKYNAERMRRNRSEDRAAHGRQAALEVEAVPEPPPPPQDASGTDKELQEPVQKAKPAKKEPEKKQYAAYVTMTDAEYNKLVERYGLPFTLACIEELDNYKGAKKGRKYDSDYRAILSWVVDRVNERRPGLMKVSKGMADAPQSTTKNPFEEWSDDQ